jgi:acetoin utilization protein AcuB
MKVANLMVRKLVTVAPNDSIEVAVRLLRQSGIRHLLVMNKEKLVGIISDRDIKRALDPQRTKKRLLGVGALYFLIEPILVREIMTSNPITISPEALVQEAAQIMVDQRFGALPVTKGGTTVGIVTETDVLRYFSKATDEQLKPAKGQRRRDKQK